jgi:hypothetical protein
MVRFYTKIKNYDDKTMTRIWLYKCENPVKFLAFCIQPQKIIWLYNKYGWL